MKEKITIALISTVAALVLIALAIYLATAGTIFYGEIASLIVIMLLVGFALYILLDKVRNMKKGLPVADERTKNNSYRAGYYGFIAAIWSAVFAPIVMDIIFGYEMESDYVTASVVIIGGIVFALSYLYLLWKGKN
jgi:hypothetical protein